MDEIVLKSHTLCCDATLPQGPDQNHHSSRILTLHPSWKCVVLPAGREDNAMNLRCFIGRHRPKRDEVIELGFSTISTCRFCGTEIERLRPKTWVKRRKPLARLP
ncbi:hypothetical protein [Novosphingobium jiangmenense]|uniref:Uncharacterized protein n=1 Tax=Novosphingobium jiangmenense TaxID=2791981 RepID=A0ABS0HKN4_9SPHN|nr:hypothetical protein [Novosphingobium jiangmenense]MBF9152815.1 hypothetical protein [Novosphingobium jiangmenense]